MLAKAFSGRPRRCKRRLLWAPTTGHRAAVRAEPAPVRPLAPLFMNLTFWIGAFAAGHHAEAMADG
ncbi:MAG: hypothetical protein ACLR3C_12080 [Eggerthella lenta]